MDAFKRIPEEKLTPQIRFAYAQALNSARSFSEAEKQLRLAVKEDSEFSEAWQLLALTLEDQGRAQEAMTIYSRLVTDEPGNRSARLFLLRHHLLSGNTDAAIDVVKDSTEPLRFAVAASSVLMEEKQLEKAENLLVRLAALPEMPAAIHFYHAALLYENGGDAARMLSLLARVPDNAEEYNKAMRMKVQLLCDLKQLPEALEAIEIVRILNPDDVEPLLLKSELLTRLKKIPEAEKTLREALALHPENEKLLFQFAYLHEIKGEHKEAMRLMEDVVRKFPDNAMALNFVGYNLADSGKELERAHVLIRKAAELEPEADFIADSLAWVCFRLGMHEEAWEHIQRAVQLSQKSGNEDPTMLEHYGDIALTQNEQAGSRLAYQAALELFLKHNLKKDAERVRIKLKKL
ncbi:MAG: tetratricopeptide repeat protein [Mailhella sp.]|nr:tetratricopeptide repeat protein [Mailhella sp.]